MEPSDAHTFSPLEIVACERLIAAALEEDLGTAGDLTSLALVPADLLGAGSFVARRPGVLAGLDAVRLVLELVGQDLRFERCCDDGACIEHGQVLGRMSGSLRALLAAERTALNFVQRLSGVATLTRAYVDAIAGLPCRIYDTRKTTPGWRVLEKYAVRVGGGFNHRMGLHDAVLIKDNHLVAWRMRADSEAHTSPTRKRGTIDEEPSLARRAGVDGTAIGSGTSGTLADAVSAARAAVPAGTVVEIEVDSIEQLEEALPGDPDIVLLDNMSLDDLRRAVAIRNERQPKLVLEASGGITLETVRAVAETGVDRISVGALTHSAPALDIALDFEGPAA